MNSNDQPTNPDVAFQQLHYSRRCHVRIVENIFRSTSIDKNLQSTKSIKDISEFGEAYRVEKDGRVPLQSV